MINNISFIVIILFLLLIFLFLYSGFKKVEKYTDTKGINEEALQNIESLMNQGLHLQKGMIIAWAGSRLPNGWALCDGNNGTPDLRNKFIMGQSSDVPKDTEGGNNFIKLDKKNLPKHNHTGFTEESGEHAHTVLKQCATDDGGRSDTHFSTSGLFGNCPISLKEAGNHSHLIMHTGGEKEIDNRPQYWALAFIMKL